MPPAVAIINDNDPAVDDCIWLNLSNSTLTREVADYLLERYGSELVVGPDLPSGSTVAFAIVDDAHAALLRTAAEHSAGVMQTIHITKNSNKKSDADFVLSRDVGFETVRSVFRTAREYRDEVVALRADVAKRKSAIGTINQGQFVFRTLEEARSLATMLALACPNSDLVVVGLQELMINAVEHGNLEISAEDKQKLLIEGTWRDEIERRLENPDYQDRVVIVSFQRSDRMISILIQDEGLGFNHEDLANAEIPSEGYRGRGIAMARDLSFSSVRYMGAGNIVDATIISEPDEK